MLGTDVCAVFRAHGHDTVAVGTSDFDIVDPEQTVRLVHAIEPDVVIHAAAYTDVNGCERDPDKAYRVNAVGAGNVGSACLQVGAEMVAISTDFVFDGEKSAPYTEFDATHPLGVYGASKFAGEQAVREILSKHKIVRTAWLFGKHGKCFPSTILSAARSRPELRVVEDQIGSPTYTIDLATELLEIVDTPTFGTFHVSNSGTCSWYELALEAIRLAKIEGVKVTAISSDEWPTATRRPKYSALQGYVRELMGKPPMRHWRDALAAYVESLDFD